jgi:hypothetical protein
VNEIGGLPYRPANQPWPKTEDGREMTMLAQFNFTDSTDIVVKQAGDLLLIFADAEGPLEDFHFEWQNLGLTDLP